MALHGRLHAFQSAPRRTAKNRRVHTVNTPAASQAGISAPGEFWLTSRRIRAQAIILAVCLWGTCIVDFSTPGVFDRAANVKFQDFLQFYISASLISHGRTAELFDENVAATELQSLVQQPTRVRLPTVYGPPLPLFF